MSMRAVNFSLFSHLLCPNAVRCHWYTHAQLICEHLVECWTPFLSFITANGAICWHATYTHAQYRWKVDNVTKSHCNQDVPNLDIQFGCFKGERGTNWNNNDKFSQKKQETPRNSAQPTHLHNNSLRLIQSFSPYNTFWFSWISWVVSGAGVYEYVHWLSKCSFVVYWLQCHMYTSTEHIYCVNNLQSCENYFLASKLVDLVFVWKLTMVSFVRVSVH